MNKNIEQIINRFEIFSKDSLLEEIKKEKLTIDKYELFDSLRQNIDLFYHNNIYYNLNKLKPIKENSLELQANNQGFLFVAFEDYRYYIKTNLFITPHSIVNVSLYKIMEKTIGRIDDITHLADYNTIVEIKKFEYNGVEKLNYNFYDKSINNFRVNLAEDSKKIVRPLVGQLSQDNKIYLYGTLNKKQEFLIKNIIGFYLDKNIESKIFLFKNELNDISKINSDMENTLNAKSDYAEHENKRVDLTSFDFYTIDSANTKDIDDAIYIEKSNIKNKSVYKLYVAISDVSDAINSHSQLDKIALEKTSTFYLYQETNHMLPKYIASDLCSLNPNLEKNVLVNEMIIDVASLEVIDYKLYTAKIVSKARLTYDLVDYIIRGKIEKLDKIEQEDIFKNKLNINIINSLNILYDFSLKYKENNKSLLDGIFSNKKEIILDLDDKGKVVNIKYSYQDTPSQIMVSQSMIAANKISAKFMLEHGIDSSIYRNQLTPKNIENTATHDEFVNIIKKSLKPAIYGSDNFGHFGMNLEEYTHFTSPIRRYSDLITHRIIKDIVFNKELNYNIESLNKMTKYINEQQIKIKTCSNQIKNKLIYEYISSNLIGTTEKIIFTEVNENGYKFCGDKTLIENYYPRNKSAEIDLHIETIFKNGGIENLNQKHSLEIKINKVDILFEKIYFNLNLTKEYKNKTSI